METVTAVGSLFTAHKRPIEGKCVDERDMDIQCHVQAQMCACTCAEMGSNLQLGAEYVRGNCV